MPTIRDPDALLRGIVLIFERERTLQGLTQGDIGDRSGIGQSTVSKYLSMKLHLSVSQFDAICRALRLSPVTVITEADEMRAPL